MKNKLPQVRLLPEGIMVDSVPIRFVRLVQIESRIGQNTEVTVTFLAEIERHDADAE